MVGGSPPCLTSKTSPNLGGKLIDLVLHPDATAQYTHGELAERMNIAFAALRAEVEEDYQARYGGELR